ncbi:hypothetical protein, partial [Flagellimonas lutimaris]|uniref:hypothetical protein n=1 Tax=Flagellimonas lutimaris TaxID=475082 RepID=UPI003F5CD1A3
TDGNYFDAPNGGGNALPVGYVVDSTMTVYVYSETGTTPNCSAESNFTVTINNTPPVDAPDDVTACDSYALPPLTDGNYFDAPNGGGNALPVGYVVDSTMTVY